MLPFTDGDSDIGESRKDSMKMKVHSAVAPSCCLLAVAGLFLAACQRQSTTATAGNFAGVYTLVSIDGKPVPTSLSREHVGLEVRSGTFTIKADGTCSSWMVFVPPAGTETTREVDATYSREGSKLIMRWKGAGTTIGAIDGNTFTMENEGSVLVYRR